MEQNTTTSSSCLKYKGFLPNINPIISDLSQDSSAPGAYTQVYINGANFFPNTTSVTFGPIQNIQVVFFSSFTISFLVPTNLPAGTYNVQVVTVSNSYSNVILLYSNTLTYSIV
jgi:hypothetical protein